MIISAHNNPYLIPLTEFFTRLALANGILFQQANHLETQRVRIEEILRSKTIRKRYWGAGASLLVRDITEELLDGVARHYPVAVHKRSGKRYMTEIPTMLQLSSAWTVSQAFEAFETFLKDTAAVYLKRNSSQLRSTEWKPKNPKQAPSPPTRREVGQFRSYVRRTFGGVDDILRRMRRCVPVITKSEACNSRTINLPEWLHAAAAVRHAAVHASGIISKAQLTKLGSAGRGILQREFPGSLSSNDYRLKLTSAAATEAVARFAEYGFLVFKELSKAETLDWHVLGARVVKV